MSRRVFRLVAVLIALAAVCLFCGMAAGSIEDCIDATCRISKADGPIGTGCAIEHSGGYVFIATNRHVVEAAEGGQLYCEFWKRGRTSAPLAARVVAVSGTADAAIVAVNEKAFYGYLPKTIPVAANDNIQPGTPIVSVGCANGSWQTAWKGCVLDLASLDGNARSEVQSYQGDFFIFVPTPAGGRSGSAVFDERGEKVLGLIFGQDPKENGYRFGFGVPAGEIRGGLSFAKTQCGPQGCPVPQSPQNRQFGLFNNYQQRVEPRPQASGGGSSGGNPYPSLPLPGPSDGSDLAPIGGGAVDDMARGMAGEALSRIQIIEQQIPGLASEADAAEKAADEAKQATEPEGLWAKLEGKVPAVVHAIAAKYGIASLLGGGGIAFALLWWVRGKIKQDIRDYVETGDPLMIQKIAARTPWKADDAIADKIAERLASMDAKFDSVKDRLEAKIDAVKERIRPKAQTVVIEEEDEDEEELPPVKVVKRKKAAQR